MYTLDGSGNYTLDPSGTYILESSGNYILGVASSYETGAVIKNILTLPDYDTADLEVDASGNFYPELMAYTDRYGDTRFGGPIFIEKIISSTSLEVTSNHNIPSEIFIYGQMVDNFHLLDKQRIFAVATAAMQEVDRQLQEDKTKTVTMESQVTDLLARVTALENK
jgi:hypothetical protein